MQQPMYLISFLFFKSLTFDSMKVQPFDSSSTFYLKGDAGKVERQARWLFCTMPLIKLVSYIYSYLFISIPSCMYREYKTEKHRRYMC